MTSFSFLKPASVFLEMGQSSLKVLDESGGLELPLERSTSGRLTEVCRERVTHSLRGFLKNRNLYLRPRAFCAIGARGVSLRRLTLPSSTKEELQRLLALQIEKEFPLAPDDLAWGYRPIASENSSHDRANGGRELIVAAVKKEVLAEYAELLSGCGLNPVFTLGALARSYLCPPAAGSYGVLDIGRTHSELVSFHNGVPGAVRILPWGGENLTRAIEKNLAISRDEAERLKLNLNQAPGAEGEPGRKIQAALRSELNSLAVLIRSNWTGPRLFLTGKSTRLERLAPELVEALGGGAACERVEVLAGEGRSAAVLGLQTSVERNGSGPALVIEIKKAKGAAERLARPAHWQWAALAVVLLIGSFSLRYVEAVVRKPGLQKRLAELKTHRDGLPRIDRELGFLQFMSTNQPPYLDTLLTLANATAPGTRIDSLSMNRRGDLSLRLTMQNAQAPEFRSKLIESGLFASVVVDELTPTPDRQRVTIRMTAQLKPSGSRPDVPVTVPGSKDAKSAGPGVGGRIGAPQAVGPAGPPPIPMPAPVPEMKR